MEPVYLVSQADLVSSISSIGYEIQQAIQRILAALSADQPLRPQRLATELKLNKDFASRLLVAIDASDPLAVAHALPGPVPIRSFLDACAGRGLNSDLLTPAREAVDAFDAFLRENFEERGELDALLGSSLRDARLRAESAAKQAMFRGAVGLKGITCRASFVSCLIHPSQKGNAYDLATVGGFAGLRRLRPDALVEYTSVRGPSVVPAIMSDSAEQEPLLTEFCRPHSLPIEVTRADDGIRYRLTGDGVGLRSTLDLFFARVTPDHFDAATSEVQQRRRGVFATIEQPTRLLVFDVFLHRDVWPQVRPDLMIYDTAIHGRCNPNDPSHDVRRLHLAESIHELGTGLSCARHAELSRYTEALDHVASRRGWDPMGFRAFRCEIQYPMYGSQVCIDLGVWQ
jgi:hypothetical protein